MIHIRNAVRMEAKIISFFRSLLSLTSFPSFFPNIVPVFLYRFQYSIISSTMENPIIMRLPRKSGFCPPAALNAHDTIYVPQPSASTPTPKAPADMIQMITATSGICRRQKNHDQLSADQNTQYKIYNS